MRRILPILGLLLLLFIAWEVSWLLHPWVLPNQLIHWNSIVLDGYEFHVCQRKTDYLFEPFETYLLVRKSSSGLWDAYCLDVDDTYGPRVKLKQYGTDILIFKHGRKRGSFNRESGTMKDAATGLKRNPVTLPGVESWPRKPWGQI